MMLMSTYKNPDEVEKMLESGEKELKFMDDLYSWNLSEGDKTFRLDYELNPNSIVFDLGGYLGDWAAAIYCMHSPKIFVFEPVPHFYNVIKRRFLKNQQVNVFNFGLSSTNGSVFIDLKGDATSVFYTNENQENNLEIMLVDIVDFLNTNSIKHIDLLKLNIEGSEYDILDRLIDTGWIKYIHNIQVQFHDFVKDAKERRDNIRERLSLTHVEKYNFDFIWEGWSLK